ncbi:hypothetical protein B1L02_17050 [Pseudoalteromonas piscicida]|uniref:Uncharacterized protein n=1 Tax=Pseudoalteromonas piscicida TaxID=43662 RepID=A0AAD0RIU0_PSEO7|nr:hypothetical protein B1L02_17050 [Pseudoalteromonas piscicida]AXQ99603.1 hypothetical protein D0N37_01835 [Pseudoalteromonas piscicida]AXR03612.1 hypothetical protein D0511_17120 [Pseudoalteromonas piscicida]
MNSTQLALKLAARKALIIRSSGYLVVLNEKFLTQLASDLLLQIEQVLRLIGIIPVWLRRGRVAGNT